MRWNHTILFMLLSVAVARCDSQEKSSAVEPEKTVTGDSDGNSEIPGGQVEAEVEVLSLTYSAEQHKISAKISYGGCAATKHQLILNDICTESYPMGCSAQIVRPEDFDPSCKMLITEDLELALPDSFDTSYVTVKSLKASKSVLVDRKNRVGNLSP